MAFCAGLGIDGPTLLLREGYWTTADRLQSIGDFVRCAQSFDLQVKYADTSITADGTDEDRIFGLLAQQGIEMVRLGYQVRPHGTEAVRALPDQLCRFADSMARMAEKHALRAVIQLHGWMYPQSATAVYPAIRNLNPKYIGVKLDPGNNFAQEGYEFFDYQCDLLGNYIAALGAKNAVYKNMQEGWKPVFVPSHRGYADYREVYNNLDRIGFTGPTILMPLYDAAGPEEYKTMILEEIQYLNQCQTKEAT